VIVYIFIENSRGWVQVVVAVFERTVVLQLLTSLFIFFKRIAGEALPVGERLETGTSYPQLLFSTSTPAARW
jgi:hypothetical protein